MSWTLQAIGTPSEIKAAVAAQVAAEKTPLDKSRDLAVALINETLDSCKGDVHLNLYAVGTFADGTKGEGRDPRKDLTGHRVQSVEVRLNANFTG